MLIILASPCADIWIVDTKASAECSIVLRRQWAAPQHRLSLLNFCIRLAPLVFLDALEVLAVVAELFWFYSYFILEL